MSVDLEMYLGWNNIVKLPSFFIATERRIIIKMQ